jgi:hypothetical protein
MSAAGGQSAWTRRPTDTRAGPALKRQAASAAWATPGGSSPRGARRPRQPRPRRRRADPGSLGGVSGGRRRWSLALAHVRLDRADDAHDEQSGDDDEREADEHLHSGSPSGSGADRVSAGPSLRMMRLQVASAPPFRAVMPGWHALGSPSSALGSPSSELGGPPPPRSTRPFRSQGERSSGSFTWWTFRAGIRWRTGSPLGQRGQRRAGSLRQPRAKPATAARGACDSRARGSGAPGVRVSAGRPGDRQTR